MADPITQAAAAFANWAYATFFASAGYGTAAHAIISATLYYGAQAVLYSGVSMGLNAVAQAQIPSPEAQKITKKQSRPPRQWCGGEAVRMSGPYMLRETSGSQLALVIAMCDFRLASVGQIYLNDDAVELDVDGWVQEGEGGRYGTGDLVQVDWRLGAPVETRYDIFPIDFDEVWPADARGDGVASLGIYAQHRSRESFPTHFPNGEIIPSAVIESVCFDWRDGTQDRANPATWKASSNPVVWTVFLEWMLYGRSWDRSIAPALNALTVEADYCDQLIPKIGGTEPRYRWGGGWTSETEPDAVRANLLASFDGWLTTDGQGLLVVKSGRYEEPTFVIPAEQIEAFNWRRGQTDEEACNHLVVSYTSPPHAFTLVECDAWVDEADVALRGKERSEPLSLPWVHYHTQSRRLAKRKMLRVNAKRRGSVTTDIWGLAGLGQRYIRIQNPVLSSMADVVCEVMNVDIDVNTSKITFDVILADPTMDEWDPATEEGAAPPVIEAPPFVPFVEQPTEFAAVRSGANAVLTWRNPFDGVFDFVNVYRAQTTNFADAVPITFFGGATGQLVTYTDATPGSTPSYWLVAVDTFGRESVPLGPQSVSFAKTYAEFVTHITAKATAGVLGWTSTAGKAAGKYRTTAAAASGPMWGSPWLSYFTYDSSTARIIQHGVPNATVFAAIVSGGTQVYLEITGSADRPSFSALDRNGFLSSSYTTYQGRQCVDLIYWDGSPKRMNPSAGTGPVPYDWP